MTLPVRLTILLVLWVAALLLALQFGASSVSLTDIMATFSGSAEPVTRAFVELRAPRVAGAAMAGAILAIAGLITQTVTRNPLADPSILGVAAGAMAAVVGWIMLAHEVFPESEGMAGIGPMSLAGVVGAGMAAVVIYSLSRVIGPGSLILSGLAINASASAVTSLALAMSTDRQMRDITFWNLGSFAGIDQPSLIWLTVPLSLMLGLTIWGHRRLDLLLLGDQNAAASGLAINRNKAALFLLAATGTGIVTAFSGMVVFIGLLAPHVIRALFPGTHRIWLPAVAFGGSTLAVMADLGARTLKVPMELPLGTLTGAIGGAFFFFLVTRQKGELV